MSMKSSVSLVVGAVALLGLGIGVNEASAADVTVSASVVNSCTLTGAAISFGAYVLAQSTASDAQDDISYDCGAGRNITLELDFGLTPNGTTNRNMKGATLLEPLPYNLYQDSGRSTVWGTGASGVTVTSTTAGVIDVPVFGRIDALQTASPDTYSDTVTFNVTING